MMFACRTPVYWSVSFESFATDIILYSFELDIMIAFFIHFNHIVNNFNKSSNLLLHSIPYAVTMYAVGSLKLFPL